jgi:pimeloyl-ACP methyl ester carboxylesterase
MKAETLPVPGATLYYEVRGSGPVLLMIPGGPMDAGGFAALAERMADQYTVVTYDCRGNSRSPAEGSWADLTVEVMADDALRLLDAVGAEPANVLGSSGGATYGLDLVARYPGRVRTLVTHEPPVSELLPDAARWHALNDEVGATYRSDGVFPALQKFTQGVGFGLGPAARGRGPGPEAAETMRRTQGNLELFAGRLIPVIGNYSPDIAALRGGATRIVVGVGDASTAEQMPYQAAHALAGTLDVPLVQFPGGHGDFDSYPDGFAARLRDVLA